MKSRYWALILAGVATFPWAANAAETIAQKVKLNIAAQPLDGALHDFAQQAGLQLFFATEEGKGITAPQVVGTFTVQAALERLLANTGLHFEYIDARTVAIRANHKTTSDAKAAKEQIRLMWAGEVADAANAAQAAPATQDDGKKEPKQIEEIVVTAQKRAQRLQDVPQSITAVTAEEINRRGLVSAEDYLRGIPGVNQASEVNGQTIVMRGIETSPSAQNFSSGPTVATYFGEAPTTNSGGLNGGTNIDLKLVDIERVEVLRGPQGTAFGNSSLGGAVRTIPVAPKLNRVEAKVGAGYSVTSGAGGNNQMIQAVGNLPLVPDKLAVRASAYRFEDSGFYRNLAGSDPSFQAAIAPFGAEDFATDRDEVGSGSFTGGRLAVLYQATDDLKFTVTYLKQKTEADGQVFANSGTYEQTVLQVAPEHVVRGAQGGVYDTEIDLANAVAEYSFGWADLVASYSYIDSGSTDTLLTLAYNGNLPFPFSELGTSAHREHAGEIRLTTKFDGAWNFLGGLYAEELEDQAHWNYVWFGSDASNFFGPGNRVLGDYFDSRNLKQKAAFAEASWTLLPRLTLTGGVRFYDFERTAQVDQTAPLFGNTSTPMAAEASGSNLRGNLSYKPTDDSLVYAGWSQGFRLGKPQPGVPVGPCDLDGDGVVDGSNISIESTKSVDSDTVDNFEIGGKFTLLERRLQIAADVYRINWDGVPVRTTAACSNVSFAYNANAGSARSEGVEFQASFLMTEAFRVDVGASYTKAVLTKDAPGLQVPAFAGDRLPGSPKTNANLALQYEFNIGGHEAFVRADSIYVGKFYGDFGESAFSESGDYVKVDTTARVALGRFDIDLFVRNLTNVDDFTFRGIFDSGPFFGYRARPRTIGIQVGYDF